MRSRVLTTAPGAAGGRFLTRDPAGNIDGENRYVGHFLHQGTTDPYGLFGTEAVAREIRAAAEEATRIKQEIQAETRILGTRASIYQERIGDCPIDWGAFSAEYEYLAKLDREYHATLFSGYAAYLMAVEDTSLLEGISQTVSDGINEHYRGKDTATAAVDALFRHGWANGFFENSEDEDYQQSILNTYAGYNQRLGKAANRNAQIAGVTYQVAWWADKVLMAAGAAGGVAQVGLKAAVCGTAKAIVAGALADAALGASIEYFDLNPNIRLALQVGRVAIAALSSKRACFPAGTTVWIADETTGQLLAVPIETVVPGERVWSYDPESGTWEACVVEAAYELPYDGEIVEITLMVSGMGPLTESVSATGNHPFWVDMAASGAPALTARPLALHHTGPDAEYVGPRGGRWVQARHLTPGDILLLKDGRSATVCGLTVRSERTHVYNLSVERLHNYTVGTSGVLVHNGNCWKKGDPITAPTRNGYPSWSTVRRRYWINRGTDGRAPTRQVRVRDRRTKEVRTITERRELHHRRGRSGDDPHNEDGLEEVWPSEHELVDPDRHTNYDVIG